METLTQQNKMSKTIRNVLKLAKKNIMVKLHRYLAAGKGQY